MASAPFITISRDERLGWQEICVRYPEQWVVLVHIDWPNNRSTEFGSAVVVGHASSREAALAAARQRLDELRDEFACLFTKRNILRVRSNGHPGGYL